MGAGNETTYDANGNILEMSVGSSTKTYSYYTGTNKVQNTDGSGNVYTYDANANVIGCLTPKNLTSLSYDPFTQMTSSITTTAGEQIDLQYGGGSEQVLKTYNDLTTTVSTLYLHGQNDYPLLEKTRAGTAPENRVFYIYGATGLIAMQKSGSVYYALKDHLGSTRVLVDENGTVAAYYDYAPFGNVMRFNDNTEIAYQFTGQEYDSESGLHNYRARLYDSNLGRFYAMDPAGQFASPFAYGGNNPVIYVDPEGRFIQFGLFLTAIAQGAFWGSVASMAIYTGAYAYHGLKKGSWGSYGQFMNGFSGAAFTGAWTGAITGGLSSIGETVTAAKHVYWGGIRGAVGGGLISSLRGENVLEGTWKGGALGAGIGAVSAGIRWLTWDRLSDEEKIKRILHKLREEFGDEYVNKVLEELEIREIVSDDMGPLGQVQFWTGSKDGKPSISDKLSLSLDRGYTLRDAAISRQVTVHEFTHVYLRTHPLSGLLRAEGMQNFREIVSYNFQEYFADLYKSWVPAYFMRLFYRNANYYHFSPRYYGYSIKNLLMNW